MNAKANNTQDKVRELQRKLYLSAKGNKKRRYHTLYDKVYRIDILWKAWKQVMAVIPEDPRNIDSKEKYSVESIR